MKRQRKNKRGTGVSLIILLIGVISFISLLTIHNSLNQENQDIDWYVRSLKDPAVSEGRELCVNMHMSPTINGDSCIDHNVYPSRLYLIEKSSEGLKLCRWDGQEVGCTEVKS